MTPGTYCTPSFHFGSDSLPSPDRPDSSRDAYRCSSVTGPSPVGWAQLRCSRAVCSGRRHHVHRIGSGIDERVRHTGRNARNVGAFGRHLPVANDVRHPSAQDPHAPLRPCVYARAARRLAGSPVSYKGKTVKAIVFAVYRITELAGLVVEAAHLGDFYHVVRLIERRIRRPGAAVTGSGIWCRPATECPSIESLLLSSIE